MQLPFTYVNVQNFIYLRYKLSYVRKFSIKEKILIHLLECGAPVENFHGEYDICFSQEGISDSVSSARSLVSRALEDFITEQIIEEKSARVKAKRAKVKIYSLTENGLRYAEELRRDAEDSHVIVKDKNGLLREIPLRDAKKLLPKNIKLIDMLCKISEDGIMLLEEVKDIFETRGRVDFSYFAPPKLKYFFNREKELEFLRNWLSEKKSSIVVIKGVAGIGKTALISKFISECKKEKNTFWYSVQEWSSLKDVLTAVSKFMYEMNRSGLYNYLRMHDKIDLEEVYRTISSETNNTNSVFVFDDCHKANDDITGFFKILCSMTNRIENMKIIVSERWSGEFYGIKEILGKSVFEMRLSGLDRGSSIEFLKARGLHAELDKLYFLTGGHPLCLELIDSGGSAQTDITRYIREEIFSHLTTHEKNVLGFASVFTRPFPEKAFFVGRDMSHETIEKLVENSLLQVSEDNYYFMHELIQRFFYSRLTHTEKASYHRAAARYYSEEGDFVTEIFHYLHAGDEKEALALLKTKVSQLEPLVNKEELKNILKMFKKENISGDDLNILESIERSI